MKRPLVTLIIPMTLFLFPSLALAEPTSTPVAKTRPAADGYSYEFTDDNMLGTGNSAYGTTIAGHPSYARTLLIRPRTQFVAEMLKSVEVL